MSVSYKDENGILQKGAGLYTVTKPIGMADIYSTEEKEVGLWIDNKPLYKKTINCGTLPNNTTKTVAHGISNIDTIVNAYGHAKATANQTPIPFVNNTSVGSQLALFADATNITLRTSEDKSPYTGYVTILYTKTTDTPWSGKFVPQGYGYVSSGDIYSEQERQVGVYVDGKPLYQKTILHTGQFTGSDALQTIAHNISNLDECVSINGFIYDAHTETPSWMPLPRFFTSNAFGISHVTTTDIYIYIPSAFGTRLRNARITLQYTKTTDVAGSGEYVPSGDKAVHYDDTEQVIGTWFGETLYRKVIDVGSTQLDVQYNSWTTTSISITNADKLIRCDGISNTNVYSSLIGYFDSGVLKLQTPRNGNTQGVTYIVLEYTKAS